MLRPVNPSFGWVKTVVDVQKYGWMGKKMKGKKYIDIGSYTLEVSVNGVICVFVVHFRSYQTHLKVCKLA